MEKFLLRTFFSNNELNVVNQQNVDIPVFFTESSHTVVISVTNGINQFIGKYFRCHIKDFLSWVLLKNIVGNRMHQMGLTQSNTSI